MDSPRFAQFNITSTPYKVINNQEIPVHVLVPKEAQTGPRPLLIHFHGGFLITGHALFPDWAAQWSIDYAIKHSAVIIAPNYRLFPESNGVEILSDVRDFWTWVEKDLPTYLKSIGSDVVPDLTKALSYGESAGGYLAIQSGLMRPDFVKAIIAAYPMTYIDSPWYCVASDSKSPMGAPQMPKSMFDDHVAALAKGTIFTGAFPPERMGLSLSTLQHGMFTLLGNEDEIHPAKVLAKLSKDTKVPYFFTFHGEQDSAVPPEETVKFVEAWKEKFGGEGVVGTFVKGDHGFDSEDKLDAEWLKPGLEGVTKAWLA
ncbi:Alpha/Beta hydrolase protein [Halenospora varia]|nr:Alpha/Beta hydrolase protein [Halenospora varia]